MYSITNIGRAKKLAMMPENQNAAAHERLTDRVAQQTKLLLLLRLERLGLPNLCRSISWVKPGLSSKYADLVERIVE